MVKEVSYAVALLSAPIPCTPCENGRGSGCLFCAGNPAAGPSQPGATEPPVPLRGEELPGPMADAERAGGEGPRRCPSSNVPSGASASARD